MIGIVLYENVFFYFYFLIVHISLNVYIICLKLLGLTENIAIEGTVSQNFCISPHSYFIKCRKNIQKNNKKLPVFLHKIKTRPKRKNLRHNFLTMDVSYMDTKF